MTEGSARLLRVFVNAAGVDVPPGATVLDAVRVFDVAAADAVLSGERIVTDSRGLPVPSSDQVHAGSIYRLLPKRRAAGVQSDADVDDSE
jgi:hypothetical protein